MNNTLGNSLLKPLSYQTFNTVRLLKKTVLREMTPQANYYLTRKTRQLNGLALPEQVRTQIFRAIDESISSTEQWRESLDQPRIMDSPLGRRQLPHRTG